MYWCRLGAACDFRLLCFCWSTWYFHHITISKIRNRMRIHWCPFFNRTVWVNLQGVTTGPPRRKFGFAMLYGGDIAWNSKKKRRSKFHAVTRSIPGNGDKFEITSGCIVWLWLIRRKYQVFGLSRGYISCSYDLRKYFKFESALRCYTKWHT